MNIHKQTQTVYSYSLVLALKSLWYKKAENSEMYVLIRLSAIGYERVYNEN